MMYAFKGTLPLQPHAWPWRSNPAAHWRTISCVVGCIQQPCDHDRCGCTSSPLVRIAYYLLRALCVPQTTGQDTFVRARIWWQRVAEPTCITASGHVLITAPHLALGFMIVSLGEYKLHVSTFATTRVALLTGGAAR